MPLPLRALHTYTRPTKEAQQALKLFLKNHTLHSQKGISRQCPYHSELLYIHKPHQGGSTNYKAIFKIHHCIYKKELAGNALTIQNSYTYTSPTKEAQQALKLFLKIPPCTHKKKLEGNALNTQSSP